MRKVGHERATRHCRPAGGAVMARGVKGGGVALRRSDAIAQFWDKVSPEPNSGCWLWVGSMNTSGHGQVWFDGKTHSAHRFSWEMHKGPIPTGHEIDHRVCRMKCCVNPDHLVPCTGEEHRTQPDNRNFMNRTVCKRGHLLSETTYRPSDGRRRCRICRTETNRLWELKVCRRK
jgi:hypothetical protein